jgi:hypothetical protein
MAAERSRSRHHEQAPAFRNRPQEIRTGHADAGGIDQEQRLLTGIEPDDHFPVTPVGGLFAGSGHSSHTSNYTVTQVYARSSIPAFADLPGIRRQWRRKSWVN